MAEPIHWADVLAIAIYFIIVIGVGLVATCRAKTDNAQGYFLAGRNMTWIPIGASLFATNVGAPMFVGIAGSAAASGIAVVMFEWHAMFMLILLGWIFLPVYKSSGSFTMPQYLKLRYGGQRIRVWLAVVHTFLTIISQIAGQMYAGALFIQQIFDWALYWSVVGILCVTAIYTIIGGLTAVIWTDTIQTIIIIIGSTILCIISLVKIGGFKALQHAYMTPGNATSAEGILYGNQTCSLPHKDSFHIFRSPEADYPWPGMIGGLTILALHAWCTDQIVVQRSLSAKSMVHAKAGALLASYLKILSFFFFVIPGLISRVLYPDEVACSSPEACERICNNPSGCSNIAYPLLVNRILPNGLRGIMLAALLAALMSSLTSIFNSSSTVFTMDIWRCFRRHATEGELMIVGRLYTLILVGISILWLPILEKVQGSRFWDYSQSIASFILPPIVVCFLLGLFWKRTTEMGAFAGLVVGLIVGLIRMGLDWAHPAPYCGSGNLDNRFTVVSKVHYLHFAIILFSICAFVTICVSIVTKPRPTRKLHRVTWWTRKDSELPDLTDDEDIEETELPEFNNEEVNNEELTQESIMNEQNIHATEQITGVGIRVKMLKWLCGINKKPERAHLTKEEIHEIQLGETDIGENPCWRKILNVNAVICAGIAAFLHIFWA